MRLSNGAVLSKRHNSLCSFARSPDELVDTAIGSITTSASAIPMDLASALCNALLFVHTGNSVCQLPEY